MSLVVKNHAQSIYNQLHTNFEEFMKVVFLRKKMLILKIMKLIYGLKFQFAKVFMKHSSGQGLNDCL